MASDKNDPYKGLELLAYIMKKYTYIYTHTMVTF